MGASELIYTIYPKGASTLLCSFDKLPWINPSSSITHLLTPTPALIYYHITYVTILFFRPLFNLSKCRTRNERGEKVAISKSTRKVCEVCDEISIFYTHKSFLKREPGGIISFSPAIGKCALAKKCPRSGELTLK